MAASLTLQSRILLADGHTMPRFGLGVYCNEPGDTTYNAVLTALRNGYRLIDTAEWYYNEADCGRAVRQFMKESATPRDQIFYTTKLMNTRTRELAVSDFKKSLKLSGLDYIDLYLVHSPVGGAKARHSAWLGCCDMKDTGLVKSIGVSNFGIKHLEQLLAERPPHKPVVNQVDLHPFMTRTALVEYNRQHDIVLEAWAPLARGMRFRNTLVQQLSSRHNKSVAQVLIRYGLDKGYVVIPKSEQPKRIVENTQVFDFTLSPDELASLDKLNENLVTDWEVTTVP